MRRNDDEEDDSACIDSWGGVAALVCASLILGAGDSGQRASPDTPMVDAGAKPADEVLGFNDCLWGGVHDAYENPLNEDECICTFYVRHRIYHEEDPDCCNHGAPTTATLHYCRVGNPWQAALMNWARSVEADGCWNAEYEKTLYLSKGAYYQYYFSSCPAVPDAECRDPDADGLHLYTISGLDCEPL